MAFYLDAKHVKLTDKPRQYEAHRKPGSKPPAPGIYQCQSCGFEDVINRECNELPPCARCLSGTSTWRLLVKAKNKTRKKW